MEKKQGPTATEQVKSKNRFQRFISFFRKINLGFKKNSDSSRVESDEKKNSNFSPEKRSIEIYKLLKRIDDRFDNQSPEEWKTQGDIPTSIDEIMTSIEPCNFLKNIFSVEEIEYIDSLSGQEKKDKEAMWKLLNGAIFLLGMIANVANEVKRNDHSEQNHLQAEKLGQLNMLWSYYATLITRSQERGLSHTMTELSEQIPLMLTLNFMPNRDVKELPISQRYDFDRNFPLKDLHFTLKIQGLRGQLANDVSDWLSDMDIEIAGGYVTPNVVLSILQTTPISEISRQWEEAKQALVERIGEVPVGSPSRIFDEKRFDLVFSNISFPATNGFIDFHGSYQNLKKHSKNFPFITVSEIQEHEPIIYAFLYVITNKSEIGFDLSRTFYATNAVKEQARAKKRAAGDELAI